MRHYLVGLTTKSDATVMPIKMGPRNSIDVEAGWCLRDTAEAPQGGLDPPELGRRSSMKYVISWQPRSNMTEEMQARSLEVFDKWSPAEGTNFLQFWGESTALVVSPS